MCTVSLHKVIFIFELSYYTNCQGAQANSAHVKWGQEYTADYLSSHAYKFDGSGDAVLISTSENISIEITRNECTTCR